MENLILLYIIFVLVCLNLILILIIYEQKTKIKDLKEIVELGNKVVKNRDNTISKLEYYLQSYKTNDGTTNTRLFYKGKN